MALSLMLFPLLTSFYLHKGLTELIKTQSIVTVTLGEDAHINCQLMHSKDILQVTWHKVSQVGTENVATYNKRFGPKINTPFLRNVQFEEAGLKNCSIVIRRVSRKDESCYRCLFNAFPEGAITGNTCLRVYELYKPSIHVSENNASRTASENPTERYPKGYQGSNGDQQRSTVSCSATGQPAPEVLWDVPANVFTSNETLSRVTNDNGTVTVTSTVTVAGRGLHGNMPVRCVASLFSLTVAKEVVTVITFKDAAFLGDDKETVEDSRLVVIAAVCGVVVLLIICVGVLLFLNRHRRSRLKKPLDSEKRGSGSPPKTPIRGLLTPQSAVGHTPHSQRNVHTSNETRLLTPQSAVRRTPHSQRNVHTSDEKRAPFITSHGIHSLRDPHCCSQKGSASLDDSFGGMYPLEE